MRRWLNVALSLGLIALLLVLLDPRRVGALLLSADPWLLLLAAASNLLANVFGAERFRLALAMQGRRLARGPSFRIHFAGQFLNQVLPTGMGGDAYRVIATRPLGGLIRAVRAVLLDRAVGFALLVAMTLLAGPALLLVLPTFAQWATALTLAGIGPGLAVVVWAASRWRPRGLPKLARIAIATLRDLARAFTGPSGPRLLGAAAGFIAFSLLAYVLTARALGSTVPLLVMLAAVPLIFVIKQIPISFAGWGPRELAAVHIFSGLESGDERSLAISLAFGVVMTLTALPGAFLIEVPGSKPIPPTPNAPPTPTARAA